MVDATSPVELRKALFRRYMLMLIPAMLIFGIWAACKNSGLTPGFASVGSAILGPLTFICAIALAVALPILYRIRFVRKVSEQQSVDPEEFLSFQLGLTTLALSAPYAASISYVSGVSLFHFTGAFLAALYAAYYYFPSEKKVLHEMRLFRVPKSDGATKG